MIKRNIICFNFNSIDFVLNHLLSLFIYYYKLWTVVCYVLDWNKDITVIDYLSSYLTNLLIVNYHKVIHKVIFHDFLFCVLKVSGNIFEINKTTNVLTRIIFFDFSIKSMFYML